tara:strand:+ start:8503 stop:9660 length:1158 start_codon:yes stop_codon:yes gene_type:complete
MSDDNSNISQYAINTIIALIIIIVYYIISGCTLYGAKVAASGLLPTNTAFYPYSDAKQTLVGEIVSNIFTTLSKPVLSEKITFYSKSESTIQSNFVLDHIRKYKSGKDKSKLMNYFVSIVEALLSFDYWVLNKALSGLNGLPELLLVLIGPFIVGFLTWCLILSNYIYLMFLWFYKMSLFFYSSPQPTESGKSDKPATEGLLYGFFMIYWGILFGDSGGNDGGCSLVDILIGCFMVFAFTILFFILLVLGWGFFPVLLLFYCFVSILSYPSEINDKKTSVMDVIIKLFRFYKTTISAIMSFVLVSSTFSSLGSQVGVASLIMVLLIAFFGMGISLFKQEPIDGLTPLIETKKTNKTPQSGGYKSYSDGDLIKQIKRVSNKISKVK